MNQANTTPNHTPLASLICTSRFLDVTAYSGYRGYRLDRTAFGRTFANDVGHDEVGAAVKQALSSSRLIDYSEIKAFFEPKAMEKSYTDWVNELIARFCYKSRGAMHQDMRRCNAELRGATIHFFPTRRDRSEGFSNIGEDALDVMVPIEVPDSEVGAAVRLALSRCR